jgi:hypothetical protein
MSEDNELYKKAEKIVDEKLGFYRHLYSYITVNIILAIINLITTPNNLWFYWVSVFWGIGLLSHFGKVFIFSKTLNVNKESMIEKEMEKMKK